MKIPWRRKLQPIPVFSLRKSHGQRSLAGYSLLGCQELNMTEQLSFFIHSWYEWWCTFCWWGFLLFGNRNRFLLFRNRFLWYLRHFKDIMKNFGNVAEKDIKCEKQLQKSCFSPYKCLFLITSRIAHWC